MKISRLYATSLALFASAALLIGGTAPDALPTATADPISDPDILEEGMPEASASTGFDLSWYTIDGGGGTSSGGGFSLSGTIGQPDAGMLSGEGHELAGGFWAGGAADVEPECPIVGDLNCDGEVDVDDLFILLAAWGECVDPEDCPADLNGDTVVDVDDLFILLANWG